MICAIPIPVETKQKPLRISACNQTLNLYNFDPSMKVFGFTQSYCWYLWKLHVPYALFCWIEWSVTSSVTLYFSSVWSDERKELEKMVVQNGGQFSPCLTRKCTHLVANISFDAFWIYYFLFEISVGLNESTGIDLKISAKVPDLSLGQTYNPPPCIPFP